MKTMQLQMVLGKAANGHRKPDHNGFITARLAKSPTGENRLMESICGRDNMLNALQRVESNKGAPGVDGMKTTRLRGYIRRHWEKIKGAVLDGTYEPKPARRKEIPKESGGIRLLGIPTVLDRLIQQAIAQVLSVIWEPTFSEFSYGFRPGRSAHMAIEQARQYVEAGYTYVVDIDLSKFLDTSSHYTPFVEVASKRGNGSLNTFIRTPLRLPRLTCMASSSPRFTRCNTVWRETPSMRMASTIGTNPAGASSTKRARIASVTQMRQGAPGVSCSPTMMPLIRQRCKVDGATPRSSAAFAIGTGLPSGCCSVG